jgi:hypothetical protein
MLVDSQSLVIYFARYDSKKAFKLLASLTRWMGVQMISCGIGPTNKAAKRM